ncbi:MAG: hypothetical protein AB1478_02080 [Nitrospirota bacterium]
MRQKNFLVFRRYITCLYGNGWSGRYSRASPWDSAKGIEEPFLALLIILFIALGLILGFFTRGQAFRKIGKILLIASLAPILVGIGKNYFYQLTLEQKLIFGIILLVFS